MQEWCRSMEARRTEGRRAGAIVEPTFRRDVVQVAKRDEATIRRIMHLKQKNGNNLERNTCG